MSPVFFSLLFVFGFSLCLMAGLFYFFRQAILLKKQNQVLQTRLKIEAKREALFSTELATLKNQYDHTLFHDSLTGLIKRNLLEDRLVQVIKQSQRYQLTFGVLFLNIDGFKIINNALGHEVGDELLKQVSLRLLSVMRQVDTVCRFSGDEFIMLVPQISKAETCGYVAQRLLDVIMQPFYVQDKDLFITACVGIAVYPLNGADGKELLKNAANALGRAKARGCNVYQFYHEEMYALSQRELTLRSSLRVAFVYQDFTIYYQPQVNTETKEIMCMEGLLRWQHPTLGIVTPGEFIRLAEDSGKIIEIGEWVIRTACQQLQKWQDIDFQCKKVSVNISLKQLENPHFIYKLSQILHETHVNPESLVFEVADAVFHKIDLLEKNLQMLKQLGVQLAIDDFGIGLLSLQHLRRFSISYLKIDPHLTQDMDFNSENHAIFKMIIALAETLHIEIIAKMVETQPQKELLQKVGCNIMQGHLFSIPRQPEEFTPTLERIISAT